MSYFTTRDGTEIFYRDWGSGPPIVFSHGWPLNADAWDPQMLFFADRGYRVIAHDRRGHGRSSQPSDGNDMDTYADDLAGLIDSLDLRDATLVAHSTGGGELVRYIGRHGTKRVARLVLVGAIPPGLLKSDANPDGVPVEVFDGLRNQLSANSAQFYKELAVPFFGYNRPGAKPLQGVLDAFWLQSVVAGIKNVVDCSHALSETDFRQDLAKIDVPTLFIHGDDDQVVPIAGSALLATKLVKGSVLKTYKGAPHGLTVTHRDQFNADLLDFIQAERGAGVATQAAAPA